MLLGTFIFIWNYWMFLGTLLMPRLDWDSLLLSYMNIDDLVSLRCYTWHDGWCWFWMRDSLSILSSEEMSLWFLIRTLVFHANNWIIGQSLAELIRLIPLMYLWNPCKISSAMCLGGGPSHAESQLEQRYLRGCRVVHRQGTTAFSVKLHLESVVMTLNK